MLYIRFKGVSFCFFSLLWSVFFAFISNVFGLIIKITVVCKINAKVYQVFCFCGVRMEIKSWVLSL